MSYILSTLALCPAQRRSANTGSEDSDIHIPSLALGPPVPCLWPWLGHGVQAAHLGGILIAPQTVLLDLCEVNTNQLCPDASAFQP